MCNDRPLVVCFARVSNEWLGDNSMGLIPSARSVVTRAATQPQRVAKKMYAITRVTKAVKIARNMVTYPLTCNVLWDVFLGKRDEKERGSRRYLAHPSIVTDVTHLRGWPSY